MDGGPHPRHVDRSPVRGPGGADLWRTAAHHFRTWRDGGDRGRFDDLVRLLTPVLWHVVRAAGTDDEQTRDVLQTVWASLLTGPESVRDPEAVGKWLVVCARRESWRVVARDRRSLTVDPEELPEQPTSTTTEMMVEQATEHDALWRVVRAQSLRCQRLLRVVACLEDTDYRTLADDLGLAVGSVGVIRRRCLDAVRASLEREGYSHD